MLNRESILTSGRYSGVTNMHDNGVKQGRLAVYKSQRTEVQGGATNLRRIYYNKRVQSLLNSGARNVERGLRN